ncbi:MAG: hypothetical protein ACPG5U_07440 [Planktomarina sp.]
MVFGRFFKKAKQEPEKIEVHYTAQLNAYLMPMDRGDVFEDPLHALLQDAGIGETDGGGTAMGDGDKHGISYIDVEIYLNDDSAEARDQLVGFLNDLKVPKGSMLKSALWGDDIPIGTAEGLVLFMNGTELSDEVYDTCDINDVINDAEKSLGDEFAYFSHFAGPKNTALYFYGGSYAKMVPIIEGVQARHRNCEKSWIEQIA